MKNIKTADFLVLGAGVIGLSIASEIQKCFSDATVAVIEKESEIGQHASGRNSGVLHSGIYYTADSLKARFTRDGNLAWQQFCDDHDIAVDRCGKLVLAASETELSGIDILVERGEKNGVEVQYLDASNIRAIEPRVCTEYPGLFVPSTSTVDPMQLIAALQKDFIIAGGQLYCKCEYQKNLGNNRVKTSIGQFDVGYIINCAGLYADKIAHDYGFGSRFTILPFKGLYLYAEQNAQQPPVHIYPVPDLNNPFLGVHFTRTMAGETKIGPTAIPAFWRENYRGFKQFNLREMTSIVRHELNMFVTNSNNFRNLALQVMYKQTKQQMIREASILLSGTDEMGFNRWGRPGIRAQLFDRQKNKLEMDFVVENDQKSLHVLNAVSPAFTCALPFASYVVEQISNSKNSINKSILSGS